MGSPPTSTELSHARKLWLNGAWADLSAIELPKQDNHTKAKLALLKAGACLQSNKQDQAEQLLHMAYSGGCSKREVAKILVSCMHSSLGRIAALNEQLDIAQQHFRLALLAGGTPSARLTTASQSRSIQELTQLGLLQAAGGLIKSDVASLDGRNKSHDMDKKMQVLQSEIATLEAALLSANASADDHTDAGKTIRSYSQLGQDQWVLDQLQYKRSGFFVEFGATDGVLLSNTYLLERHYDWQGILAEPNPNYLASLQTNRHCIVTDACIAAHTGESVEFVLAKEYGGIRNYITNDKHAQRRLAYAELGNTIKLTTISLQDFLLQNNAPRSIDYLSIDTEGSELAILQNFPLQQWDIQCITIEHNHGPNRDPIRQLLHEHGYEYIEAKWDDWFYRP